MFTNFSSFSNVYLSWLHPSVNGRFISSLRFHDLASPAMPSNVANYRSPAMLPITDPHAAMLPITHLPSACVLFPKYLKKMLFESLSNHFLFYISTQQFGFMKGRSCFQQVLTTMISLYHNSRLHYATDIIYLDFKKALNSIPHGQLLIKLWKSGVTYSFWDLIKNYFFFQTSIHLHQWGDFIAFACDFWSSTLGEHSWAFV